MATQNGRARTKPPVNGSAPTHQAGPIQGQLQLSPELQQLMVEAVFWRSKYFELQQHTNQVIAMLSRPPAAPQQVASMFTPAPAGGASGEQSDGQPQEPGAVAAAE